MTERMDAGKFSGLWQRAAQGGADRHDAYALAREADRARREEAQQQARIHALEVQQAELLRQVKELAAALEQVRDSILSEARVKILKTADVPVYFRRDYEGREYEAAARGYAAGANHALDTITAMRKRDVP